MDTDFSATIKKLRIQIESIKWQSDFGSVSWPKWTTYAHNDKNEINHGIDGGYAWIRTRDTGIMNAVL